MVLRLRPGLARAWRAPGRLQIGLRPGRGLVLDGLEAADERLLAALDEGLPDRRRLHSQAACWGVPPDRADHLVALLAAAGVLAPEDPPAPSPPDDAAGHLLVLADALSLTRPVTDGWAVLARRSGASVLLEGGDPVGLRLARLLVAAGVGAVRVRDDAAVTAADTGPGAYPRDALGERRERAAAALLAGAGSGVAATRAPSVVVLVASGAVRPGSYDPWLALDVPHLPVLQREGAVDVGPLVRAGGGCCLRCQDLYRTDRDPEWPRVAAQLAAAPPGPLDPLVAEHAAVLAATLVLAVVDGRPDGEVAADEEPHGLLPGRALEVVPGRTAPLVRTWPAHPRCGCLALPDAASAAGPAGPGREQAATMDG